MGQPGGLPYWASSLAFGLTAANKRSQAGKEETRSCGFANYLKFRAILKIQFREYNKDVKLLYRPTLYIISQFV
jgi:hypothetical protein